MIPEDYLSKIVVVDTETSLTYVGNLAKITKDSFGLEQVILYDESTGKISIDQFLVECASFFPSPSRKAVWINRQKIISLSLLSDVIIPGK